jgi:DNA-binding winged helix-turn-helix (wHTH) protein
MMEFSTGVRAFGSFQLDLEHRELCQGERQVRLTAKPFDALVFLVENRGQVITRDQLRMAVWDGLSVTDPAIEHAVNKVRRALNDDPANPEFIQTIWGKGYIFVADVESVSPTIVQRQPAIGSGLKESPAAETSQTTAVADTECGQTTGTALPHRVHVVFASLLYALLYAVAVVIETAYGFDRYGRTALSLTLPIFSWIGGTTLLGFWVESRLLASGRRGGAVVATSVMASAAASLLIALQWFLPASPITLFAFQGFTAHAAYLKDASYFYVLGIIFLLLPYHYVVSLESEIRVGRRGSVGELLGRRMRSDPRHLAVYFRPSLLLVLLVGAGIWSQVSIAHIFENLRPSVYMGLYMNLVQIGRLLAFVLGLECLAWYHLSLARLHHA